MSKYDAVTVNALVGAYNVTADKDYETRSETVAQLAEEFGLTVPEVRGVLVTAGVYKAKEAGVAGAAKAAVSKEELVKAFEAVTGTKLPGLSGASRKALQAVWDYLVSASDRKAA